MTFVHRNGGPGTPISYAGPFQAGYAEESLDDTLSAELIAFLNPEPPPPPPDPVAMVQNLTAALVAKGTITAQAATVILAPAPILEVAQRGPVISLP